LANVQEDLKKFGYSLVVYDAYRPQKGVDHFVRWSEQPEDFKTKAEFYPYLDKSLIIPNGYVAAKSGHSRGSTVDLTIIPLGKSLHEVKLFNYTLTDGTVILYRDDGSEFMGGHFDYFGEASHHDTPLVAPEEAEKRNLLRSVMQKHGFNPD
jgi:zinc D-Ala-D-Ala dipeptidase